jgi:uncharacterized protein
MVNRPFWQERLESAWRHRSIVWLSGVRRVGKTFLCQSLPRVEYFDCELPRVRRIVSDPESFLEGMKGRRLVLDEIHRLDHPSELLKIAADHFPTVKIIATGSSTLGASAKFRDTLAGRKANVWLTPITLADMESFQVLDMKRRMLRGGLPPFLLSKEFPEQDFQEWVDAYWAKDIQELFRLERRSSFEKCFELLMAQSGGIFEAQGCAAPCEVSRGTIANYLKALEATYVVHIVRPYSSHKPTEIVAAPKVYGFDTGFVCYHKGWHDLRRQDMGTLWEHIVLNELHARLQSQQILYWRDKRGHEVDFILSGRRSKPLAIECKWSADDFDAAGLAAFRRQYPHGENVVVAHDVDRSFTRRFGEVQVRFVNLAALEVPASIQT